MPAKKKTVKQTQQKMFTFGEAIANFWNKYIVFSGTAQRSEFWWWTLFNCLISAAISIVFMFSPLMEDAVDYAWFIATIIPWLALYSRRFHDAGYSAMWVFIPLAVFVFLFPLLLAVSSVADTELVSGLLGVLALALIGFIVFWFVVLVTPSKLKGNPYRK